MLEYVSEAVVLDREENGDLDVVSFIFTKKFGKLRAKAKSARKITSKLASHLEPGNLSQVRLVEKNGFQITDALKQVRLKVTPPDLYFLNQLLPEAEPDFLLWEALVGKKFNWQAILKILGWDPALGSCEVCAKIAPEFFHLKKLDFVCERCVAISQISKSEVVYLVSSE